MSDVKSVTQLQELSRKKTILLIYSNTKKKNRHYSLQNEETTSNTNITNTRLLLTKWSLGQFCMKQHEESSSWSSSHSSINNSFLIVSIDCCRHRFLCLLPEDEANFSTTLIYSFLFKNCLNRTIEWFTTRFWKQLKERLLKLMWLDFDVAVTNCLLRN